MLFISLGIIAGLVTGLIDVLVFKRGKKPINKIFAVLGDVLASNVVSVYVMDLIHRVFMDCSVFKLAPITKALSFGYMGLTAGIGFLWILTVALLDGRVYCSEKLEYITETWEPEAAADSGAGATPAPKPVQKLYDSLYDAIRNGKPQLITPQAIRRRIEVMQEAYRQNGIPFPEAK